MLPRLRLAKDVRRRLRLGHPWIYAAALKGRLPPAGTVVEVTGDDSAALARGFADPDGPIAVRVLSTADGGLAHVDGRLVAERVARACALRASAADVIDADALRLLHGEGDGLPGLVLDWYAGVAVIRLDGAAAAAFWRPHLDGVLDVVDRSFPVGAAWLRAVRGDEQTEGVAVRGAAPSTVVVRESAARFEVDVVRGQKTGFFLDQRENRRLVAARARGRSVLNLFSYTGGFSIAAALVGARRVTSVDVARPAIDAAGRNFALNGLDAAGAELVCADVFDFLREAARTGRSWDIVVCDPPSFAPSERARPRALEAYRELNRAAAAVVAPGGLLATASCSSHVAGPEFVAAVADGLARAGRGGRVIERRGAGVDHPVLPAFPEGEYLKFVMLSC